MPENEQGKIIVCALRVFLGYREKRGKAALIHGINAQPKEGEGVLVPHKKGTPHGTSEWKDRWVFQEELHLGRYPKDA